MATLKCSVAFAVSILLHLSSGVSAYPQLAASPVNPADPRFTQWKAPGPNDVRSPCPGLNSLANHGFIHHDGRNMTVQHLINGLAAGMNVGTDFSLAIGSAGLLAAPASNAGSFDLNQLDQHNFPIEHDGSLSRRDAYEGNDYSFYKPNWNQVLSHYAGMTHTTIVNASMARIARINDSRKRNPTFTYGPREFVLSYGETGLYLQTMSDPTSGVARLDFIRMLFEQEKLPYELGWRPSTQPITLASLAVMAGELFAVSGESMPEGLEVLSVGVLKDAFSGYDPVTGLLGNITSAL